jgi:hypothetical protein
MHGLESFEITAGASSIVPAAPYPPPFFMGEAGAAPATVPAEPGLMMEEQGSRNTK